MKLITIGIVAALLFWLQTRIYRKGWLSGLSVKVSFEQESLEEGMEGNVVEVIENRKRLPLPVLKVKFVTSRKLTFSDTKGSKTTDLYYRNDVFRVGALEKITRRVPFVASKRGYMNIQEIDLVGGDLFLTSQYVKTMGTDAYLYVYPKPFTSLELSQALKEVNGEVQTMRHVMEDPFTYRGIRPYQPTDEMRSINWKATAKTRELMVNQKGYTYLRCVRIFLNTEDTGILKKEEAVEASMQIVMRIADFFLHQGMSISVYGNGRDILTGKELQLPEGAGEGMRGAVQRSLARIDTETEVVDFNDAFEKEVLQNAGGTYTIFVSPNIYEGFGKLLMACKEQKMPYTLFFPTDTLQGNHIPEELMDVTRVIYTRQQ